MRFQAEGQATVLVLGGVQGQNPPDLGLTQRALRALCGSAALRLCAFSVMQSIIRSFRSSSNWLSGSKISLSICSRLPSVIRASMCFSHHRETEKPRLAASGLP